MRVFVRRPGKPTETLCFNEAERYYSRILEQRKRLDTDCKAFIEANYDRIAVLWNRFCRFQSRKEGDRFYYSSPVVSALGFPPPEIAALGIILYVKSNRGKSFELFTERRELYSYFTGKRFVLPRLSSLKVALKVLKLFLDVTLAKLLLPRLSLGRPSLVVHSFHRESFLTPNGYQTDKFPDLSRFEAQGLKITFDICPTFFPAFQVLKLRKYCTFAPAYLSYTRIIRTLAESLLFSIKSRRLFGAFSLAPANLVGETFFNLLIRDSITALTRGLPDGSLYLKPWENRGYELGTEMDLKGLKLLNYLPALLSPKISTEASTYRFLRHRETATYVAMSEATRDLVHAIHPHRQIALAKSSRVAVPAPASPAGDLRGVLVICSMEPEIVAGLVRGFSGQSNYHVRFKPHPYLPIRALDQEEVESRRLSEALPDYPTAVYAGFTSASVEAYMAGLKIYKFKNPNRLRFDTMDNFLLPEISKLSELPSTAPAREVRPTELVNRYLGVDLPDFGTYLGLILEQIERSL